MITRGAILFITVMFTVPSAYPQRVDPSIRPLQQRTAETDREALRLMRNEKLALVLPGAMRDNNIDMWIHVSRPGDLMEQYFGSPGGYLIFADLGETIERAVFGGSAGTVEGIDVRGSMNLARAFHGYNYNNSDPRQGFSVPDVYDEISDYVAERDPQVIAVNFSDWLPVADGISHAQFLRLENTLGPEYSSRIISAEAVITDFLTRRTTREIAAQTEVLALARQRAKQNLAQVIPGVTRVRDIGARVYYSATSKPEDTVDEFPPDVRYFLPNPDYVLQPGDLFVGGSRGGGDFGTYMGFAVDTKIHAYILREGETRVPDFLQEVFDKAIAGQWIMRDHMKVGMTGEESLAAMVKAMEDAGYIYTPFIDNGAEDYVMIQEALSNTDKPGFSIDNHAMGNTGGDVRVEGPSMAAFRVNTHNLKIQENHIFAFEYMVHMNIDERPGYPLAFNISNPQVVTSKGVEFIQPPNEEIFLIH